MKRYVFIFLIIKFALIENIYLFAQENTESNDFSYALKLYNEKFYELSAQQFSRFVNKYPKSDKIDDAGFHIGMAYFKLGDYENARIEFQNVAVNFPESKVAAESWFSMGECYEILLNDLEAAKAFETVKILYPGHQKAAESTLRSGKLYQKLHRFEKAEQLFILIQDRYIESSFYFPAIMAHGSMSIEQGKDREAREKLQKVIDRSDNDNLISNALFLLAELNKNRGYIQEAIKSYQIILNKYEKTDSYISSVLSLSKIFLQNSRDQDAQKILTKALKSESSKSINEQMQEKLGDCYYLDGKYALALKYYNESTGAKEDSSFVVRKLKISLSWQKQNNLGRAIEELNDIIVDPVYFKYAGYDEAKKLYFDLLLDSKNYEKGIADLYTLKSLSQFDFHDKKTLVAFLKKINNWLGIIKELEPSIHNEEKFIEKDDFIFDIALAYENLNQFNESARYYQKILFEYASSDLSQIVEKKLEYLNQHEIVDQNVGIGQLALLIGDVLNQEHKGKLIFKLGKIYFENLKDYKSALKQFENAINLPENASIKADIYHYIGLTYQRIAEDKEITAGNKSNFLSLAKENLSQAMENIASTLNPDLVAWDFVELGIRVDNSPPEKQIVYYETLLKKYPDSNYREKWYFNLARIYGLDDSALEKSLTNFEILVKNFESSNNFPVYLYERAKIKQKLRRADVIDDFKRIAGSYPNSQVAAQSLYNLALIFKGQQKFDNANEIFNKINTDYYYTGIAVEAAQQMGDTYFSSGKNDLAINNYNKQLESLALNDVVLNKEFVTNNQLDILFKKGKAYFREEKWIEARQSLSSYLSSSPNGLYNNEANFLLGDIYLTLNDQQSAISNYLKVSNIDTLWYPKAQLKIADTYFNIGEYSLAAKNYANLNGLDNKPEFSSRNIISLIRSGEVQSANKLISTFKKKYAKEDNIIASFQFEFGDYYRKQKDFNEAIDFFNNVINKFKKTNVADDAEYFLALTYLSLNKQKEALDILTNFVKKYPDSENIGSVFNTLGGIYFRSEKYESAMITFKSALQKELTPELRKQVLSNLIKAYTFVNFWDAALAHAREYIETYPHAEDKIDKQIIMAQAYTYLNQIDQAVELLKNTRLMADSEKEPEIQFYIGDAYFKAGQYENAIAEFVKIPLLSRKTKLQWEASALYYSGQAYEKLGRNDEAVRMYQEIVKRPGIDMILKKDAQKRINQING